MSGFSELYHQYAKSYVSLFTQNELDEEHLESLDLDTVRDFYNEYSELLRVENTEIPEKFHNSKHLPFMIYCGARRLFQKSKFIRLARGHANH